MEETIKNTEVMEEVFETEVIDEATELAENAYVEDSGNGTKAAVAAGLTTVLVGGFLIGKKLIKNHKAKKAAAEAKAEKPDSLDIMMKLMEEKEAEIDELKAKIESMIPQKFSNKETEKKEEK